MLFLVDHHLSAPSSSLCFNILGPLVHPSAPFTDATSPPFSQPRKMMSISKVAKTFLFLLTVLQLSCVSVNARAHVARDPNVEEGSLLTNAARFQHGYGPMKPRSMTGPSRVMAGLFLSLHFSPFRLTLHCTARTPQTSSTSSS